MRNAISFQLCFRIRHKEGPKTPQGMELNGSISSVHDGDVNSTGENINKTQQNQCWWLMISLSQK
jgi:hypothetical protein